MSCVADPAWTVSTLTQIRASRYAEAGADAILIHSKSSDPEEVLEFIKNWNLDTPLVIIPTNYPSLTEKDIEKLGKVKMVIYANHGLRVAVKAMEDLFDRIRQNGSIEDIDEKIITLNHLFELQGVPEMKKNEEKYLR